MNDVTQYLSWNKSEVLLPGMAMPSSKYSLTEGLRNAGGAGAESGSGSGASSACAGSRETALSARILFTRDPFSEPPANRIGKAHDCTKFSQTYTYIQTFP